MSFASRGQVPKRRAELRRRNKPEEGDAVTEADAGEFEIKEPDEQWHHIAYDWYLGLAESGQSAFYEQSDWDVAYFLAEQMSRHLRAQFVGIATTTTWQDGVKVSTGEAVYAVKAMSGGDLSAMLKGMSMLLVTESERRRARIELTRGDTGDDPGVSPEQAAMQAAQAALGFQPQVIQGGLTG